MSAVAVPPAIALADDFLARSCAADLRDRFADYNARFRTITQRAKRRFERREWIKTRGVDAAIEFVALDIEPTDRITHPVARHVYAASEDLAETFRRVLDDYR